METNRDRIVRRLLREGWVLVRHGVERMAVATSLKYPVIIDGELGAYGIVIPDVPGCFAMGKTVDEALEDAADGLAEFFELFEERGKGFPEPSDPATLELEPGEMIAYVPLRVAAAQEPAGQQAAGQRA